MLEAKRRQKKEQGKECYEMLPFLYEKACSEESGSAYERWNLSLCVKERCIKLYSKLLIWELLASTSTISQ